MPNKNNKMDEVNYNKSKYITIEVIRHGPTHSDKNDLGYSSGHGVINNVQLIGYDNEKDDITNTHEVGIYRDKVKELINELDLTENNKIMGIYSSHLDRTIQTGKTLIKYLKKEGKDKKNGRKDIDDYEYFYLSEKIKELPEINLLLKEIFYRNDPSVSLDSWLINNIDKYGLENDINANALVVNFPELGDAIKKYDDYIRNELQNYNTKKEGIEKEIIKKEKGISNLENLTKSNEDDTESFQREKLEKYAKLKKDLEELMKEKENITESIKSINQKKYSNQSLKHYVASLLHYHSAEGTGKTYAAFALYYMLEPDNKKSEEFRETKKALNNRVIGLENYILDNYNPGDTIIMISHGAFMAHWRNKILSYDKEGYQIKYSKKTFSKLKEQFRKKKSTGESGWADWYRFDNLESFKIELLVSKNNYKNKPRSKNNTLDSDNNKNSKNKKNRNNSPKPLKK